MATDFDEFEDENESTEETPQFRELRKQLKAAQKDLKEFKEQATEAEKLRRELAFSKAGVDLADDRSKIFVRGYDGELDAEKIADAAKAFGLVKEAKTEETGGKTDDDEGKNDGPPSEEVTALAHMEDVVSGTPYSAVGGNKDTDYLRIMREAYEAGNTVEEVARKLSKHGYPVAKGFEE